MDAISSYGQAYDIMDYQLDLMQKTYGLLTNVSLLLDEDMHAIKIDLTRNQEYHGFNS